MPTYDVSFKSCDKNFLDIHHTYAMKYTCAQAVKALLKCEDIDSILVVDNTTGCILFSYDFHTREKYIDSDFKIVYYFCNDD